MSLLVNILNGQRQGEIVYISAIGSLEQNSIFFLEDEALEISYKSESYLEEVSLILYENEVEPTSVEQIGAEWVYKWKPKRLGKYSFECFFHNFFGIAELALEVRTESCTKLLHFQPVEVLARKINAERVENMLSYLSLVNSEALCSFFRVTRRKAGFSYGDMPADIVLERIENITDKIIILIKKIIQTPITKLTAKESYVLPSESNSINDLTLAWLSDNADELFETDNVDLAILEYNHRLYGATKIIESRAIADTDVYENQVLHGFVSSLTLSTATLLSGFETPNNTPIKRNSGPFGYVSFFTQISKFQKSINERKVKKCHAVLSKLHALKRSMSQKIPTRNIRSGIPTFTMKAKKDSLYLSTFKIIVDWHRCGRPDWSVQDELLSIQSIPKLFEYYSLFYIKDFLDRKFLVTPQTEPTSDSVLFRYIVDDGVNITLHYEPKYWAVNHIKADARSLVNTEAWTVYNNEVLERSNVGRFSNRSPDFVITIGHEPNVEKYIILDAKYTTSKKAFIHYLPDLTMKYLHGLHPKSYRSDAVTSLIIINPDEQPHVKDFHNKEFGVFSETPAFPSMICASISPGEEFEGNNDFESNLDKIIERNINALSSNRKKLMLVHKAMA